MTSKKCEPRYSQAMTCFSSVPSNMDAFLMNWYKDKHNILLTFVLPDLPGM